MRPSSARYALVVSVLEWVHGDTHAANSPYQSDVSDDEFATDTTEDEVDYLCERSAAYPDDGERSSPA